ncbi:hypothetical protein FB451DRAFT_1570684 [Mycena latifolia]|nr:hypothetical protein FB451DRAFT_1570684 [Mycena latifolia]
MAAGDSAKADQIAFHIYTKLFHVLHAARASEQGPPTGKTDKWFNLETPLTASATTPTGELDAYRALSALPAPRPLAVQVLLAPSPRFVLLEEWVLAFAPPASSAASSSSAASTKSESRSSASTSRSSSTDEEADVAPPTIYKNAIPLFRALFALLRILPAWRAVASSRGAARPRGIMARGCASCCVLLGTGTKIRAQDRDGGREEEEEEEEERRRWASATRPRPGRAHRRSRRARMSSRALRTCW